MRRLLVCLVACSGFIVFPGLASAATIVVDTTATSSGSACALPAAIQAANTNSVAGACPAGSGADRIEFAVPAGSTITLAAELPEILGNLEIAGPGATLLAISGDDLVRPFRVGGTGNRISGLTIRDGRSNAGGGLWVTSGTVELQQVAIRENEAVATGGTNAFPAGGGIYSQGSVTLIESSVVDNVVRASGASSQNAPSGGGISSPGSSVELVVESSLIAGNSLIAIGGAGSTTNATGGGLALGAKLVLRGSTVSGNVASATASSAFNNAAGGGINVANSGSVQVAIEGSTIAGNSAAASGGGGSSSAGGGATIYGPSFLVTDSTIAGNSAAQGANFQVAGTNQFRNTIVAAPIGGPSCTAPLTSLGYNLEQTSGCGFVTATDLSGVDPLLGALAANGGPTPTMALGKGSPALDQGLSLPGETDQRGLDRPVEIAQLPNAAGGNGADIGAFELQLPLAEITRGPAEGETTADSEPSFDFRTDEVGATFLCALDGAAPAPCTNPFKAPKLSDGAHTFAVTAVSVFGYSTPTPTSRSFTVDARVRTGPPRETEPQKQTEPPKEPPAKAPESTILGLPGKTTKTQLSIRFSSTVPGSTFQCKLDARKWRSCRSPYKTPKLALGKHVFKLRAIGPTGLVDPTPAVKKFKVVAPR